MPTFPNDPWGRRQRSAGGERRSAVRTVYDTPEWRERVGPRHETLVSLWLEKGVGTAVSPTRRVGP